MDKIIKQGLLFDAGFSPKSEQQMKDRLLKIFSEAGGIDFNTAENKKSIQAMAAFFRDMFESVGNKKIDFTKIMELPGPEMFDALKQSIDEIADVWANMVSQIGTNGLRNVFMKDERSIEDAAKRLSSATRKSIQKAFRDVRGVDINKLLTEASGLELDFRHAENWEERAAALLRYTKVRDKILKVKDSGDFDPMDIDRTQKTFFEDIINSDHRIGAYLVRDIKEVIPEIQTSLNNIFRFADGQEIEVVPQVVKTLYATDFTGGKKPVKIPVTPDVDNSGIDDNTIDADFKDKLVQIQDLLANARHKAARELRDELLSKVPEDLRSELENLMNSVLSKSVLKDDDFNQLWERFQPYLGSGAGGDTGGIGDGSGIGGGVGREDDVVVEGNEKKIESYEELSEAVSRYIELAKSLVSTENNTKEHQQIKSDMDFADTFEMHEEKDYIDAINRWQKNISKIKSAIKAGASSYTDEDGYEYDIVENTLSKAESKLRGYIYRYAENFNDIGVLIDGAKTKGLKNIINKEIDKFKADEEIQRQQEEIAGTANTAAIAEMEQIEEAIKRSAPTDKSDKISNTLSELQSRASRVDRFTQSVTTDGLANDMGIISPHKEIENNAKAIKSYEELCSVVERYNELVKKRYMFTGGEHPTLTADEENEYAELYGRLNATREGVNINRLTGFDGIDNVEKLAQLLGIQIPQAAQKTTISIAELNNKLQDTENKGDSIAGKLGGDIIAGSGQTDGATIEEVENLEKVRKKVSEITSEVKEKTQEFLNEQTAVKKVAQSEVHALGEVEKKVTAVRVGLSNINTLLNNIKKGKDIGAGLSNININVNHTKDEKQDEQVSINQDQLKSVLENIVYQVKITHSDTDKEANKVAIDETTLEHVLKRVFTDRSGDSQNVDAKVQTDGLVAQYKRAMAIIAEWQTLYQNLNNLPSTNKPAEQRKNVLNAMQGVTPELAHMIGGAFEEAFKTGFKGFKTADIARYVGRITEESLFGSVSEQTQMLQEVDFDNFDFDKLPSKEALIDSLLPVFDLLRQIDAINKGVGAGGSIDEQVEQTREPYALDKTLLDVKGVLEQIRDGAAKQDVADPTPTVTTTDVGNVLATENTLGAIKTAVEAINSKVVKGTKIGSGGHKKEQKDASVGLEPYAASDPTSDEGMAQDEDKSIKLLADIALQSKRLEKFVAKLQTSGQLTEEYQIWIDNLTTFLDNIISTDDMTVWKKAFQYTDTSVGIDNIFNKAAEKEETRAYQQLLELQRDRNKLELQYEKTQEGTPLKQFYADQLALMDSVIAKQEEIILNEKQEAKLTKMRADQEFKLGEAQAKADTKAEKKRLADEKKLAKRQAMVGKAGSAIGRAENTWLEAEGLDKEILPDDFKKQIDEYYDALDKLRIKHNEINSAATAEEVERLGAELIEQTKNVNKQTEAVGRLVSEYQKLSGDNVDEDMSRETTLDFGNKELSLSDYETQMKSYVREITKGRGQIKSFNAETKTLTYTVKTGKNEFTEYTAAVRNLDHQLVSVRGTTKRTETFIEATARKMKELTSYFSGMAIFSKVGQALRQGIQYVREIDLALTELKKVTNETEESYDRFLETAAKTADKVGSTIQKVVSSTADWARLGYSMKEAAQYAESTQILMNVSEFTDVNQATDTLISAVQAFEYTAETSMDVVDLLNTIGKQNCRNYIVIYG